MSRNHDIYIIVEFYVCVIGGGGSTFLQGAFSGPQGSFRVLIG